MTCMLERAKESYAKHGLPLIPAHKRIIAFQSMHPTGYAIPNDHNNCIWNNTPEYWRNWHCPWGPKRFIAVDLYD